MSLHHQQKIYIEQYYSHYCCIAYVEKLKINIYFIFAPLLCYVYEMAQFEAPRDKTLPVLYKIYWKAGSGWASTRDAQRHIDVADEQNVTRIKERKRFSITKEKRVKQIV